MRAARAPISELSACFDMTNDALHLALAIPPDPGKGAVPDTVISGDTGLISPERRITLLRDSRTK